MPTFPFQHHRSCLALWVVLSEAVASSGRKLGKRRHIGKGRALWRPSDAPDRMYVLERGRFKVQSTDEGGREFLLQLVEDGEAFGELCFCAEDGGTRNSTATATHDSDVIEFAYDALLRHLRERADLLDALMVAFCLRLTDCELRSEALAYGNAEQRIGRLLLMLATRSHQPARNVAELVVTHGELALLAGMTRPHVTVVLNRFKKQGAVDYKRAGAMKVNIGLLKASLAA